MRAFWRTEHEVKSDIPYLPGPGSGTDEDPRMSPTGTFAAETTLSPGGPAYLSPSLLLPLAVSNPIEMLCVSALAESASLGRIAFFSGPGRTAPEIRCRAWEEVFFDPDPIDDITGVEFLNRIISWRELTGNAFVRQAAPPDVSARGYRTPRHVPPMTVLPSTEMRVNSSPAPERNIASYNQIIAGKIYTYAPDEILHFRKFNPFNKNLGMPTQVALQTAMMTMGYADRFNLNFFLQGGDIRGVLQIDDNIGEADRERVKRHFREQYLGVQNHGTPPILEGGMKYVKTGSTPQESQFLEGQRYYRQTILGLHGVPAAVAGIDDDGMTDDLYKFQIERFWDSTVFKLQASMAAVFQRRIWQWGWDGVYVRFDNSMIPECMEDEKEKRQRLIGNVRFGLQTQNEARAEMGLPPVPGGDILTPLVKGAEPANAAQQGVLKTLAAAGLYDKLMALPVDQQKTYVESLIDAWGLKSLRHVPAQEFPDGDH